MCFSATASFTTAAVTGSVGLICLTRVQTPRDLLVAVTPLLFAVQQCLEGLLWLRLRDGASSTGSLVLAYLLFARVFWPIFAPTAVLIAEPVSHRRLLIAPWAAVGLGVAAYLLWGLLANSHSAALAGGHIAYDLENVQEPSYFIALAYLSAISVPLLLSSQTAIKVVGVIVATGSVIAYVFYLQSFQSVWCYFAAAASVVLLAHFQWLRLGMGTAQPGVEDAKLPT